MGYLLASVAMALALTAPVAADGSIEWAQIESIVAQSSTLRAFVTSTLDVSSHGVARRFGWQQKHLGGARVGPYEFPARRKGATAAFDLTLTICTEPSFFDASGKPTTWDVAASFTERLLFVAVSEPNSPHVECPDWVGDP